jgi:hypothetical protein
MSGIAENAARPGTSRDCLWRQVETYLIYLQNAAIHGPLKPRRLQRRINSLKRTQTRWGILLIMLSAVNAVFAVGAEPYIPQQYLSGLNALLSLISSIIASVLAFLRYEETTDKLRECISGVDVMVNEITSTISVSRAYRTVDPLEFMNKMTDQYLKLLALRPIFGAVHDDLMHRSFMQTEMVAPDMDDIPSVARRSISEDNKTSLTRLSPVTETGI